MRTIEHPQGLPQQIQLRQSQQLLLRCVQVLVAVCQGGSHAALEHLMCKFAVLPRRAATVWTLRSLGCLPLLFQFAVSGCPGTLSQPTSCRAPSAFGLAVCAAGICAFRHHVSRNGPAGPYRVCFLRSPPRRLMLGPWRFRTEAVCARNRTGMSPRTAAFDPLPLGGLRKAILSFLTDRSFARRLLEHVSSAPALFLQMRRFLICVVLLMPGFANRVGALRWTGRWMCTSPTVYMRFML